LHFENDKAIYIIGDTTKNSIKIYVNNSSFKKDFSIITRNQKKNVLVITSTKKRNIYYSFHNDTLYQITSVSTKNTLLKEPFTLADPQWIYEGYINEYKKALKHYPLKDSFSIKLEKSIRAPQDSLVKYLSSTPSGFKISKNTFCKKLFLEDYNNPEFSSNILFYEIKPLSIDFLFFIDSYLCYSGTIYPNYLNLNKYYSTAYLQDDLITKAIYYLMNRMIK